MIYAVNQKSLQALRSKPNTFLPKGLLLKLEKGVIMIDGLKKITLVGLLLFSEEDE